MKTRDAGYGGGFAVSGCGEGIGGGNCPVGTLSGETYWSGTQGGRDTIEWGLTGWKHRMGIECETDSRNGHYVTFSYTICLQNY